MRQVSLWLDRVEVAAAAALAAEPGWLSESEHARLAGLSAPRRRAQFLAGRWLARRLLAAVHGGDPATDWPLSAGASEPPRVLKPSLHEPPYVAISHSGDLVACAIAAQPVGIDVELARRERDVPALAQAICTPAECTRLRVLEGDARQRHFQVVWTLKEAWLKRRHEGITPGRLARLDTRPAEGPAEARVWQRGDATLALAAEADAQLHWHGDVLGLGGEPGVAWHVTPLCSASLSLPGCILSGAAATPSPLYSSPSAGPSPRRTR